MNGRQRLTVDQWLQRCRLRATERGLAQVRRQGRGEELRRWLRIILDPRVGPLAVDLTERFDAGRALEELRAAEERDLDFGSPDQLEL